MGSRVLGASILTRPPQKPGEDGDKLAAAVPVAPRHYPDGNQGVVNLGGKRPMLPAHTQMLAGRLEPHLADLSRGPRARRPANGCGPCVERRGSRLGKSEAFRAH